jgi:hypothetical protein
MNMGSEKTFIFNFPLFVFNFLFLFSTFITLFLTLNIYFQLSFSTLSAPINSKLPLLYMYTIE